MGIWRNPVDEMGSAISQRLNHKKQEEEIYEEKTVGSIGSSNRNGNYPWWDAAAETAQAQRTKAAEAGATTAAAAETDKKADDGELHHKRLLMFARDLAISPSVTPLRAA